MGFSIPVNEWLFGDERKSRRIRELLLSRDSRIAEWLNQETVRRILDTKLGNPTWNLVFLEEWLRQNRF
jgi:hypothetical protein